MLISHNYQFPDDTSIPVMVGEPIPKPAIYVIIWTAGYVPMMPVPVHELINRAYAKCRKSHKGALIEKRICYLVVNRGVELIYDSELKSTSPGMNLDTPVFCTRITVYNRMSGYSSLEAADHQGNFSDSSNSAT